MPAFKYKVSLSDGRVVHLESAREATEQEISAHLHSQLGEDLSGESQPFGSKVSKFAFPVGGAIATDLAFGAPLTEAGAAIGTGIAPGIGTVIGGGLGAGLSSFLGATAGARLRQRLQAQSTDQQPAPFSSAVKEAIPFGTFGGAARAAGAGLEAITPVLKSAPRFLQAIARPGTIANAVVRGGAGAFGAGTAVGVLRGHSPFEAVKEGVSDIPVGAALGAGFQAVPNFLQASSRNAPLSKAAEAEFTKEADTQIQSMRQGRLPQFLRDRGREIWSRVEQPIVEDSTPISLKEFYDKAVEKYGEGSEQVSTLLKSFGRDPQTILKGTGLGSLSPAAMSGTTVGGEPINADVSNSVLAKIFESDTVTPEKALDAATALGGKIKHGAASGSRLPPLHADAINSDARSVIYDVLKGRLSAESQQTVNDALKEYGEFATQRNQAISLVRPFSNKYVPTESGVGFLRRIASGTAGPRAADEARLAQFLQEGLGRSVTKPANPLAKDLSELAKNIEGAKDQEQAARLLRSWITRIGIAYPVIRAILRGQ